MSDLQEPEKGLFELHRQEPPSLHLAVGAAVAMMVAIIALSIAAVEVVILITLFLGDAIGLWSI